MKKIRLGRTGMMVSKVGFGAIPIQRLPEDEAVKVVRQCLELGITYIDTANAYSNSEERIGKAIAGRRDSIILATKSHPLSRQEIEKNLKLSLKRLGVDYIDLYQLHQVGDFQTFERVMAPGGPLEVVKEAQKAGVIKHIGVSSHQIDVAKALVKSDRFETIMYPFNLITAEAADELLPLCREHDVGFIAMKPMCGGILEKARTAFKFIAQFPEILPLVGIEKIAEMEEIIAILKGHTKLTLADNREIERLRTELGTVFCRRCEYCQPCEQKIPISMVMTFGMFVKRMPPSHLFQGPMALAMAKVSECIECGECETRCPYHLPIREMLKKNWDWYEAEKRKAKL